MRIESLVKGLICGNQLNVEEPVFKLDPSTGLKNSL